MGGDFTQPMDHSFAKPCISLCVCSPDSAHLGQLVDCLVAVVDVLPEEVGELLEAEYLERAAGGDLADGGGQEAVDVVAVAGLHEDGRVGEARREHLQKK